MAAPNFVPCSSASRSVGAWSECRPGPLCAIAPLKEVPRLGGDCQIVNGAGSGGLTAHGHARGISAEGRDVSFHPAQGRKLVHQAVIAGRMVRGFCGQFWMCQKAEYAHAIVEGDNDDAFLRQTFTVVEQHFARAARVGAPRDVNENRQTVGSCLCWRPHIEEQAVFAHVIAKHVLLRPGTKRTLHRLHGAGAKRIGFSDAGPGERRLRGFPTSLADRRRGVGDAFENRDRRIRARDPGQLTLVHGDHG